MGVDKLIYCGLIGVYCGLVWVSLVLSFWKMGEGLDSGVFIVIL